MRSQLITYLFFFLFSVFEFALARDAEQIVLGNLRSFKLFEPTPTIAPEMGPVGTEEVGITTEDDPSAPWTAPVTTATSGSGSGGGATCVQGCLARAASQVGCGGSANFWCVCKKRAYVGRAWDCFGQSGCSSDAIGRALADLNVACQPYKKQSFAGEAIPESPMVTPEGTPVVVPFESNKHVEL